MQETFARLAAVAAGAAVAAAATVTGALPAQATSTGCDATFAKYATLRVGAAGAQAKAAECLLAAAGYTTTVDGHFSVADGRALGAFRRTIGFSSRPVGGPRTWSALVAHGTAPALHRGDQGADVFRLQGSLRAAKFTRVSITGTYDAATTTVVKAVQKAHHLPQSGAVDTAFWHELQTGKVHVRQTQAAPRKHPTTHTSRHPSSSKGAKALAFAKRQLGERYRYGAAGPSSWDCSGLTMKAWSAAGVRLPHSARAQFHHGKKVSRHDLRKGDLVFFYSGISHVGIYAGNGRVIHASRPGHPVAYIKITYMPYEGARRPG